MTRGALPPGGGEVGEAERRRGIALVLERHPGIEVPDLQRILGRVGVEVDTDTLVADLDALARARAAAPVADREAEPIRGGRGWPRSLPMVAAVAVLVVVVAVVLAVVGDDGGPAADEPATAGGGAAAGESALGPGRDPALDLPEARTDDFDRDELGELPYVAAWEPLSGEWAIVDGRLDVTSVPTGGPAVAALDVGGGDVRAQVEIDRGASRAGIAFRIVDDRTFLLWAWVPEYGTTNLFVVVDGRADSVVDTAVSPRGGERSTLGISLVGDRAELLHDGVLVATYDGLPPPGGATRIGVAALVEDGGRPRFDDFRVLLPAA